MVKRYEDLLGNERILTEDARKHILSKISQEKRSWRKEVRNWGLRNIHNILLNPDMVLLDQKQQAILYCKNRKMGDKDYIAAVVTGAKNRHYIYTVEPIPYLPEGLKSSRYVIIYL